MPVGITRAGACVLASGDPDDWRLDPEALPEVLDNGTRVLWPESAATREMKVVSDGKAASLGDVDVVFPILHGPFGEDGTIQGLLELIDLPYVGSGVLASALGMDKDFAKVMFRAAGIPVAPSHTVTATEWADAPLAAQVAAESLGYPLFVKPARAGSSMGVSKVHVAAELAAALRRAFAEDQKVLVEAAIVGREVELGVLGARPGESPRASVAGEIVITGREFYDFEGKYLDAPGIDLVCPAPLADEELRVMQDLAVRAFTAIGAAGLARVDFFLTPDGFVLNEINTMPGFTPISMFPKCWQASGLSYEALLDALIELALGL